MGKCPLGISADSARSTLLGISCSNTFFIDLYQRLCLQSQCGWAKYNIAWHEILSESRHRQLQPSAKQNKQVIVHLHHLSHVCSMSEFFRHWQAANQPVFWSHQAEKHGKRSALSLCNSYCTKGWTTLDPSCQRRSVDTDFQLRAKGGVYK